MSRAIIFAPGLFLARNGLGSHPAASLQDERSRRVRGVRVEEVDEGGGLVLEAGALPRVVAVDIGIGHGRLFAGGLYQDFRRM